MYASWAETLLQGPFSKSCRYKGNVAADWYGFSLEVVNDRWNPPAWHSEDVPDVFLELHQFPDVFQQSQRVPCSTCSPSIFPTSRNPRNPTLSGARHAGRRTLRSVPASQTCYSNWKRCADDAFAPRACAPPISRRCGIPWLPWENDLQMAGFSHNVNVYSRVGMATSRSQCGWGLGGLKLQRCR